VNDRFGQMSLDDADFLKRDNHVLDLVKKRHLPTVLLYGGGYNRDREHTARLHADSVLRAALRGFDSLQPHQIILGQ